MTTQQCNKCHKRFNVLVKGVCANCNPEAWAKYHNNLTGKSRKK
ncbi:hypothetical protein LCGC14_1676360 [marine sediment metagenome]|uniref:Uncharacterized protein n=1 Tax=marine sediment metagenome TaxID=412755 RepID=A0A0F9K5J2_9ZZZZ